MTDETPVPNEEPEAADSGKAAKAAPSPAKKSPSPRGSSAVTTLLAVLVAIAAAAALRATAGVLIPLVLAIFLCYLILPIMRFLKRFKVPEGLTMPASLMVIVGFLVLLNLVIVQTIGEIQEAMPGYVAKLEVLANSLITKLGPVAPMVQEVDWVGKISAQVGKTTTALFGSVINFVANLVLVVMYMIFIMLGRKSLMRNLTQAFSSKKAAEMRDIIGQVNIQVQRYIAAKIMMSAATGTLMFLVLWFFDVDFALFWGFLGFLLNFIPTVGSAVAALIPITISLLQFGDPTKTLYIALGLIAVQQGIGNGIEPKFQGDRLDLSPIFVLFSLVFFGWLWGFWGMVMSVPLMATLKIIFEHSESLKPLAIMMQNKGKKTVGSG